MWKKQGASEGGVRLCVSCGGRWPVYSGSAIKVGDFGGWNMLGVGCSGTFMTYQNPFVLPNFCSSS